MSKILSPLLFILFSYSTNAGNGFCILEKDTVDVGVISFEEQKSEILRVYFFKRGYIRASKSDTLKIIFYRETKYIKPVDWNAMDYGSFDTSPNARRAYMDSVYATITIRNIEGNTGLFCKKIYLACDGDTACIYLKGRFKDTEKKRIWINKKLMYTTESYFTKGYIDSVRYITLTNKNYKTVYYRENKPIREHVLFEPCAKIVFKNTTYDFGVIDHGSNGIGEFLFKNEGDLPLIFSRCTSSCGCVVPQCPREPIYPGVSDKVKFKYDTNRVGPFTKTLTITTNSCEISTYTLSLKGTVTPPKEEKQWHEK